MQKSGLQIAGVVLIVIGIILQIVSYIVGRTITIFAHPSPKSIIDLSAYEFISHTIASILILLGFFLMLWDIGKRVKLGRNYKNIAITILILALLIPSFIGLALISHLLASSNGVIVSNIITVILYPIGILFIGIALFNIATKLMENKATLN